MSKLELGESEVLKNLLEEKELLEKQNKILKEALEFYADDNNHEQYGSVTYTNELDLDKGFRARQALKKCKGLSNEF